MFVPNVPRSMLDEVEVRWRALCKAKPNLFDGRVSHVLGVHRNGHGGAMFHTMDCAYRYHAVQDERFDVGMRGLGVKGIVMRDGEVLLGKRDRNAAMYAGSWEFVPAGVVEPGRDPGEVIRQELAEETGLSFSSPPRAVSILYDPHARTWEVIYLLEAIRDSVSPARGEHEGLKWSQISSLLCTDGLSPIAKQMVAILSRMGQ